MTTYYTAADGTSQVATVGPADTGAGLRAKLYAVLTALLGIPAVVQLFGVITNEQAASINQVLYGVLGLVGAGGLGLAASKTQAQTKNGTFDAPPPPPPAITAVESIAAVANQFQDLTKVVTEGVEHVQKAAGGILTGGLGSVLGGSLVDQVLRDGK